MLDIRKVGLLVFLLCLAVGVHAQAMPDFVLKGAQAINARYGQRIDVNNVYWDYRAYSVPGYNPAEYCPDVEANRAPFSATTKNFYVVMFTIIRDGLRTTEEWHYLVYDDFSYLGPCLIPAPPTPVPTAGPTAIPPTPSSCGGLVSRLAIGQQGRVTPGDPNNIRADHGVSTRLLGEIPAGGVFTVLDGPRCTDSGTWWRVDYNGLQGWTLEGNASAYFTEPASFALPTATIAATVATSTPAPTFTLPPVLPTALPTQVICLPAIPPRLRIGEMARVTAGGVPNNMREQGGRSSKLVGEIPPLGVFTVLEGPRCTGDGAWWRVDYDGLQGWTLEGMEAEYWVEPILPNLQPMTMANLTQQRTLPKWPSTPATGNVTLEALSDEAVLIASDGSVTQKWTPVDAFATADELTWQASEAEANNPIELANEQWHFYGVDGTLITSMPVPASPANRDVPRAVVSPDHLWSSFFQDGRLWVVNLRPDATEAEKVVALPDVQAEPIVALDFSADSRTLVAIGAHTIYAWDTVTWQPRLIHTLTSNDPITAWPADLVFAISPSGQHLFVAPYTGVTGMVTPLQGNIQAHWGNIMLSQVQSAAFVRDQWIAIGGADAINNGILVALSVETLDALPILSEMAVTAPNGFTSIAVNPDGTLMATYNASTGIRLWGVWQP